MADLTNPAWIKLKGGLFLFLGIMSGMFLLVLRPPGALFAALYIVSVWAFCRFYYFAFYGIERYLDASYRFSGLLSFACYLLRGKRSQR